MIKHFDFFRFYHIQLIVACDEKDEILGYCVVKGGDELCQVFVYPKYRGEGIVDELVWKAVEFVKNIGGNILWGVAFKDVKDLYVRYVTKWGATLVEEIPPKERTDGQWRLVFDLTKITSDRRTDVH